MYPFTYIAFINIMSPLFMNSFQKSETHGGTGLSDGNAKLTTTKLVPLLFLLWQLENKSTFLHSKPPGYFATTYDGIWDILRVNITSDNDGDHERLLHRQLPSRLQV